MSRARQLLQSAEVRHGVVSGTPAGIIATCVLSSWLHVPVPEPVGAAVGAVLTTAGVRLFKWIKKRGKRHVEDDREFIR